MRTAVVAITALTLAGILGGVGAVRSAEKGKMTAALEKPAPAFTLKDYHGKSYSLADYAGKYVVLEWTNMDCPFVRKHYDSGNMQHLQQTYREKQVVWLRICSSAKGKQGNFDGEIIAKRTKSDKAADIPYLVDADGTVGRAYGAKTTPHMFVIDPKGILIYAGAIDDKPSTRKADIETAHNYVAACLDAAMAGKKVEDKLTQPYGCSVKYAAGK